MSPVQDSFRTTLVGNEKEKDNISKAKSPDEEIYFGNKKYTSIFGQLQASDDQEIIIIKHFLKRDPVGQTLKGLVVWGIIL